MKLANNFILAPFPSKGRRRVNPAKNFSRISSVSKMVCDPFSFFAFSLRLCRAKSLGNSCFVGSFHSLLLRIIGIIYRSVYVSVVCVCKCPLFHSYGNHFPQRCIRAYTFVAGPPNEWKNMQNASTSILSHRLAQQATPHSSHRPSLDAKCFSAFFKNKIYNNMRLYTMEASDRYTEGISNNNNQQNGIETIASNYSYPFRVQRTPK